MSSDKVVVLGFEVVEENRGLRTLHLHLHLCRLGYTLDLDVANSQAPLGVERVLEHSI